MDFEQLLKLYQNSPQTAAITDELPPGTKIHLKGILRSADTFALGAAYKKLFGFHLIILNDKEEAAYFQNDLKSILEKKEIFFFPDSYKKPDAFDSIQKNNVLLRAETLNKLIYSQNKGEIIVTYPQALIEKIPPIDVFKTNSLLVKIGEKIVLDQLIEQLASMDFEATDFVYEPGQFSVRGDIIDIFSYSSDTPYRIELFGNEVESIRHFDPVSQLSDKKVEQIGILQDITLRQEVDKVSILQFLPPGTTIWVKDIKLMKDFLDDSLDRLLNIKEHAQKIGDVDLAKNIQQNYINPEHFISEFKSHTVIEFGPINYFTPDKTIIYNIQPQPVFKKNFNLLVANLNQNLQKNITNILFASNAGQIERFYNIFEDLSKKEEDQKEVVFYPFSKSISSGFIDIDLKVACYTDHQIFERFHKYNIKQSYSKNEALLVKTLKELKPGDFVTHIDHGIGVYSGLEKIEVNGKIQESLRLIYANKDLLYVSINSLHKVSKYIGKEGTPPKLSKIGSDAWEQLKRKTKKKVKDIARDLIKLYAKRRASKGFPFHPDTYLQNELEASFIYEDTPDQARASHDVKKDMEAPYPMDRLVCGDVGFGKTEIAIRAAYKAAVDGKQVAVLVPTTILALQHYKTFKERFGDLPCNVDYINRFKNTSQRKETFKKLQEGKTDIIIGTHALLGKEVVFKDLGLLIIDEEQKFGVAAKEKIRSLAVNVDTLTLTATPIPRTLQFSLMGSRDLSIINTPPPNRQPIQTELIGWNDETITDAINFEVNRGGQVFFIHDKVKNIEEVGVMIRTLCPGIRLGIAHGQMPGDKLESILQSFLEEKYDVLLSTSIVESGIDISNVNTIIINNAHQFGLSDLHQLRGRVGRSNQKAFCYMIAPPLSAISTEARKRLQTIVDFSDLGSGFNVAMRDLDIRGAGNILGGEQSGFVSEMGFDTYQKILDEAIVELKETEFKDVFKEEIIKKVDFVRDCQLETDMELLIPDSYVRNINERLSLYTELGNLRNEDQINLFKKNLVDRFGPTPVEVEELCNAIKIQWMAKELGFERLTIKNNQMKCFFIQNQQSVYYESPVFSNILKYIQEKRENAILKQTEKYLLLIFDRIGDLQMAINEIQKLSEEIKNSVVIEDSPV